VYHRRTTPTTGALEIPTVSSTLAAAAAAVIFPRRGYGGGLGRFDSFQHPQVESLRIDGDDGIRAFLLDVVDRLVHSLGEVQEAREHFRHAHHRQLVHGKERAKARSFHQRAANSHEPNARVLLPQALHGDGTGWG
jgi:hypothetical protein